MILETLDYKLDHVRICSIGKFAKEAWLYKIPTTGTLKWVDKNTSALVGNYLKISESMTFDYSVDFKNSKDRLNKVANDMINNFDLCWIKSSRRSMNNQIKKYGITINCYKRPIFTPKSQSPHNELVKKKANKYEYSTKIRCIFNE